MRSQSIIAAILRSTVAITHAKHPQVPVQSRPQRSVHRQGRRNEPNAEPV